MEILLYHQMDHHRNLVTTLFLSSANKQTISKKKTLLCQPISRIKDNILVDPKVVLKEPGVVLVEWCWVVLSSSVVVGLVAIVVTANIRKHVHVKTLIIYWLAHHLAIIQTFNTPAALRLRSNKIMRKMSSCNPGYRRLRCSAFLVHIYSLYDLVNIHIAFILVPSNSWSIQLQ